MLVDEQPRRLLGDERERLAVLRRGRVRQPAVGELGHRPRRLLPLQEVEADVDLAGDLDAGEADLAVAHRRVHVADREHAAGLADGEEDARAGAVPVVVEVAAVPAGEPVRELLAAGRDADDADHRHRRERDAVVHLHDPVLHLEQPRQRRLHLVDQLAEAGDERRDAPLDRAHVEDLGDERVARLGALDRDRAGGAVDPREVDLGDEVVLAPDLAGEAVVRLEGDDVAGLDLEHRLEIRAERPDDLIAVRFGAVTQSASSQSQGGGLCVQRPPSIVATTCTSRSSSGSHASGSRSSTTRSA